MMPSAGGQVPYDPLHIAAPAAVAYLLALVGLPAGRACAEGVTPPSAFFLPLQTERTKKNPLRERVKSKTRDVLKETSP
jgi:hypothetical protein